MKQLLLVRHAKSNWDNPSLDDFDRPLNDRGNKDAPTMAKRLLEKKIAIDAFISSPAKRAFTTCKYFAAAYGIKEKQIQCFQDLYLAGVQNFYDVIKRIDDNYNSIAVFSHNNGITSFANELTKTQVDNMPTCSIFAVKLDIKHWKDFEKAKKEFWFFDYPKLKA